MRRASWYYGVTVVRTLGEMAQLLLQDCLTLDSTSDKEHTHVVAVDLTWWDDCNMDGSDSLQFIAQAHKWGSRPSVYGKEMVVQGLKLSCVWQK